VIVIGEDILIEFAKDYPKSKSQLERWFDLTEKADWNNLVDVRKTFKSSDLVGKKTVFDIAKGYRLITEITYTLKAVVVECVLTHDEYMKGAWKRK
jgi:mRNA interferase HigB